MSNNKKQVHIYLPDETVERLDLIAEKECRSRTGQIEFALNDWLRIQQLGAEFQDKENVAA